MVFDFHFFELLRVKQIWCLNTRLLQNDIFSAFDYDTTRFYCLLMKEICYYRNASCWILCWKK